MMASNGSPSVPSLRVCYFGTYRAEYSRNRILLEGLRLNGVTVIECHTPLWQGGDDRIRAASGGWWQPAFLLRAAKAYCQLVSAHRRAPDYDVMLLGYPGQIDVFLARLLAWVRRRPLVLDAFMSIYLIAWERGLVARHPLTGRLIWLLEKLAYRLSDRLIQDTQDYADWLCRTFDIDHRRVRLVPTGADDSVFHPIECAGGTDGVFRVLYYGSFIPNHGVGAIVEAARLLQDQQDIQFELVGDGPDRVPAENFVHEWGMARVAFTPWLDPPGLAKRIARADLCLGAFGHTPQSMMTIQNKIYECLAMRRCVVTGDSPAIRRAFDHGRELWLCERSGGAALADAIRVLRADPELRASLAGQGHRAFLARYTASRLGEQLRLHLQELQAQVPRKIAAGPGVA